MSGPAGSSWKPGRTGVAAAAAACSSQSALFFSSAPAKVGALGRASWHLRARALAGNGGQLESTRHSCDLLGDEICEMEMVGGRAGHCHLFAGRLARASRQMAPEGESGGSARQSACLEDALKLGRENVKSCPSTGPRSNGAGAGLVRARQGPLLRAAVCLRATRAAAVCLPT